MLDIFTHTNYINTSNLILSMFHWLNIDRHTNRKLKYTIFTDKNILAEMIPDNIWHLYTFYNINLRFVDIGYLLSVENNPP